MITEEVRLYTKTETAKLLGIGKTSLNELIISGRIGIISLGKRILIPFSEIVKFIENSTTVIQPVQNQKHFKEEISSTQFLESLINNN